MEGPTNKGEEPLKKASAVTTSSIERRGKEVAVNAVNPTHPAPQQYSMNFTSAPPVVPPLLRMRLNIDLNPYPTDLLLCTATSTPIYGTIARCPPLRPYSTPSPSIPTPGFESLSANATSPTPQGQQGGAAQPRRRRQYPSLLVLLAYIYRQLQESDKIGTIAPGPNFDPTIQDQSKQCKYHRGAPGHTLETCWRLRERIHEMIDAKGALIQCCKASEYIPAREPYSDDKVPWTYEGRVGSLEQQFGVMGITRSGRVYENPTATDKGKAPTAETKVIPGVPPTPPKKMAKSPAHISLLALFLSSEPHREALLRVLTTAQVPKGTSPDRIEETSNSIFSNTISFLNDELPSEGCAHSRALHIVCKCNNHIVCRVMIDNGSALNVCPVTTLKQMNVDVGPCSFSVTFQVLDIPNAFSLLLARRGNHLHRLAMHYGRLNRGMQVPPLSHFFPGPPLIIRSTLDGPSLNFDDTPDALPTVYAVTEEIPSGVHIRPAQENEELNNRTSVPRYSTVIADVLHSNPNHRHVDSNPFEECLGEPGPIYFGEGLDEDSQVPEIEESLRRLEDRQLTSLKPTEGINVGTKDEPRTLKIGTGLDPTQRARMIDFLTRYQEVFAWSYADMPGLDPSIVKHFLPLDTEKFPPKRQQLRRQRASLLLRIKEEVVKQINAGFLEVCNYSEWVANIVPVEKKDGRVRVCVDYRDLNKASPKDNFPLPHIDVLVDNTARHTQFSFMDGFSGYNQIRMAEEGKIKTTFTTMWGTFCYRVMPFGLKNAGATYQRAMVTLLHDMMHKEIEVYAITLASVTAKAVACFLRRDVIARYGVPATIIMDNAKNLNNKVIDELCAQFKIQDRNSTPYRPQMNGVVEACYQQRMARAFNARVRHHEFSPGDLILRKVLHVTPNSRGKFSYKYDGPFVVKETFSGGAVILSDMDGTKNALPVNADAIKKYYP
ncbi:hypothetical protein CRG98_025775 [Punica granatum]|uniref:Integrase catalytic domain-containing protein n=1 Tax=Punica granatum TaxID=22663 RepID=A0A2I0JC76_PUNGR|nr:hypothetical protein CRG98_025775 [Punica granatum]